MNVLVVCEENMFRDGLGLLLQARVPQPDIVYAESPQRALALRRLGKMPAVVLLDLGLAEPVRGPGAVDVLRDAYPMAPIIGLADERAQPEVERSLKAGVRLCVLKSASGELLIAALHVARSTSVCLPAQSVMPGPALEIDTGGVRLPQPTPSDLGLTPKQARVLNLLLQGKSAKGIARELGLCTGTVKTHTTAVLRALNVNTRVQAVLAARRMGLQIDVCH